MMIFVSFFLLFLFAFIGRYFYHFFSRMLSFFGGNPQNHWVKYLLIVICVFIALFACNPYGVGVVIFSHLFFFCLLLELVFWGVKKKKKKPLIMEKIYNSGVLPVFFTIVVLIFAYWNMIHVVSKEYTIYTDKNLENPYKIVFLSDLHFGTTLDVDRLAEYAQEIEALQPDLVILGGDIVDEHTNYEEMNDGFRVLGGIKSKYGVFYVYGNHDKAKYDFRKEYYRESDLEQALLRSGIVSLVDDTYVINDELTIIGRDDFRFPKGEKRKDSISLLEGIDENDFLLLVDHHPYDLEKNAQLGYDLQLSGHTHGGQIFPTGLVTELFGNGLNYGYRKIDRFQVIVSSGMGGWAYPFRTGTHSEYVVINIVSKPKKMNL